MKWTARDCANALQRVGKIGCCDCNRIVEFRCPAPIAKSTKLRDRSSVASREVLHVRSRKRARRSGRNSGTSTSCATCRDYRLPPAALGLDPAPRQRRRCCSCCCRSCSSCSTQPRLRNLVRAASARVQRRPRLVPGWFVKLVMLALIWAYLHHFCAGMRHLLMDMTTWPSTRSSARSRALVVLVVSLRADAAARRQAVRSILIGAQASNDTQYGSKRLVVGAHYGLRDWLRSASPPS